MFNLFVDNPALPNIVWQGYAMRVTWLVVVITLWLRWTPRLRPTLQRMALLLWLIWFVLPGAYSPAYWLGLAFMAPSGMTVALCLTWVYSNWAQPVLDRKQSMHMLPQGICWAQYGMLGLGLLLGWVLMADMLGWLPWTHSIYAFGFTFWAVVAVLLIAVLPWLIWGTSLWLPQTGGISPLALPLLVLTVFVLTRLPTGNVWDALLDPWLWMVLHFMALQRALLAVRRYRKRL